MLWIRSYWHADGLVVGVTPPDSTRQGRDLLLEILAGTLVLQGGYWEEVDLELRALEVDGHPIRLSEVSGVRLSQNYDIAWVLESYHRIAGWSWWGFATAQNSYSDGPYVGRWGFVLIPCWFVVLVTSLLPAAS